MPAPKDAGDVTLPEVDADDETIAEGASLYDGICRTCHGFNVVSGGMMPDLRFMSAETHVAFDDIVLRGTRAEQGMAPFADLLNEDQSAAIYAYIVTEASKLRSSTLHTP